MTIIQRTRLNENELLLVRALENVTNEFDHLSIKLPLKTEFNIANDISFYFLMYLDSQLVSFLMIFMPTYTEAEIMGFTNPLFRKRGYFSKLLESAKANLIKYAPLDLLFVCDYQSSTGVNFVNSIKTDYSFSEYSLKLNPTLFYIEKNNSSNLILEPAKQADVNDINDIYVTTFSLETESSKTMVVRTLESKQKTQYVLRLDGIIIATSVVSVEDNMTYIIGVAVNQNYQNQGFGFQMMSMIITNLIQKNITNIMIEVDSMNQRAYHLYQKLGFVKQAENQYYRLKLEKEEA